MQTLDLAGSFIIGGLVLLTMTGLFLFFSSSSQTVYSNELTLNSMDGIVQVLERDINKIGYGVTTGSKIDSLSSTLLKFRADVDKNGVLETIRYSRDIVSTDTFLTRSSSEGTGSIKKWKSKVNIFSISAFDSLGSITSNISAVSSIKVNILINNSGKYSSEKSNNIPVRYQKTFFPRNL